MSHNLHDFLRYCALSDDPRLRGYIWIDALVINQNNISERSHQVNIMGDIYKAASRVIVWLGIDDDLTEIAFALMRGLLDVPREARLNLHPHDVRPRHTNPLLNLQNWKALAQFFQRSWFNRAWVIQEVVFANAVNVLCGSHEISWDDLHQISHFLATTSWSGFFKNKNYFQAAESAFGQWHNTPARLAAAKVTWAMSTNEGLLYALIRSRPSSCEDPRDKVYSQLALGKANLFPDYKLSVSEVYINAAIYILETSKSLLLLTCVEGESFQSINGLPSWVPDWSVTAFIGLRVTGYRQFNATGIRLPVIRLSMDGCRHVLEIEATRLDTVAEISEAKQDLQDCLHTSNFWEMCANLSESYMNGERYDEVIWRCLMTNRQSIPPAQRVQYPAFPDQLGPSFRDWILWRYATALDDPTTFPVPFSSDSILPTKEDIQTARAKAAVDPAYLTSLEHRASVFDVHYSHAVLLRPFRTAKGYFGIGTQCLRKDDSVWIAPGCRVPLILRRVPDGERYRLVGGSYVHGVMNGEVLEQQDVAFEMVGLE